MVVTEKRDNSSASTVMNGWSIPAPAPWARVRTNLGTLAPVIFAETLPKVFEISRDIFFVDTEVYFILVPWTPFFVISFLMK